MGQSSYNTIAHTSLDSRGKGGIQVPHKAVKWQQGSNPVLFHCKHGVNIHVIFHKCQGMDVSNHLLSGNLGIWALSTTSASNTPLTSHKSLQLLHMFPITPAQNCVSQLLPPPAHLCPRTAIISSSSTSSLGLHLFCSCHCQISLHQYAQWPCQTLSPPPLSGQMSFLAFQCYLIENHMMSKGWTRLLLNHSLGNDSLNSLIKRVSFKTLSLSNEKCASTGCSPVIFPAPHCLLIL